MSKSIRFTSGSNGIGDDAGPFTIYHTSREENNKIIDQVTKLQIDSGLNLYGIDNDKFKFIIYNSASGAELEVSLPGPQITSFSPTFGSEGDNIVINGSGFVGMTSISFGNTAGTFSITSNSEVIGTVGEGSSGKIIISTPGGVGISENSFTFINDESELIYDLGTYYFDKDSTDLVCSGTTPTNYNLFIKDKPSLYQAFNTQTTVYRNKEATIKALPGFYAVKDPEVRSFEDISFFYYIDSNGYVTVRLKCNDLPSRIDDGGDIFL